MQGESLTVLARYGHPGDYFPAMLPKLLNLTAYSPTGKTIECSTDAKPERDLIAANVPLAGEATGTWVFAARYDNGFYAKLPDGRTVNSTKLDMRDAVTLTHHFKFGKALFYAGVPTRGFDRIVGHRLELIPQSDHSRRHQAQSWQ